MAIIFNVTYLYFAKIVNIFVIPSYAPLQYNTPSNQIFPVLLLFCKIQGPSQNCAFQGCMVPIGSPKHYDKSVSIFI